MKMNSDMKIERTYINIFMPSLISSLFNASKALFAIVNSITKNTKKKLDMKDYTNMNVYEVE